MFIQAQVALDANTHLNIQAHRSLLHSDHLEDIGDGEDKVKVHVRVREVALPQYYVQ
jgi:hypothetical protein